ncbi:hypothetical protein Q5O24_00790 [Eubacteriaceae bacterium ES3]|nr:hypothetical protein Q5O24_00790 [Eubacteriaceae bacterium ES3]
MVETISQLIEMAPVFSVADQGCALNQYFEENAGASGVVIVNDDHYPIGLIMRNHFYQNIGTQFGFAIYLNRSVELIMKKEILVLESSCDLAQFGMKAMNRPSDDVYDYVIVVEDGHYRGVVSISNFLAAMSERKEQEIELLNQQQRILQEANEKEKLFRMQIEMKNKEIRNLMNNADQGFLSFGSDLVITEEYSKVCDEIFGWPIGNLSLLKLLSEFLPKDEKILLSDVFSALFEQEKKKRAKTFIRLLPRELLINNRYIQLAYKIIAFDENKAMMLILTDITDKKALENKAIEEKNNMKLILSAADHKREIQDSLLEAYAFFESAVELIEKIEDPLPILFRIVHTMKGDFALHSFYNTAVSLHQLEDQLSGMLENQDCCRQEEIIAIFRGRSFDEFVLK